MILQLLFVSTAVVGCHGYAIDASGSATCDGKPLTYGNVSVVLKRYGVGCKGHEDKCKPIEEKALITVPVKNGRYSIAASGVGDGGSFGTVVKCYLELTHGCFNFIGIPPQGLMAQDSVPLPKNPGKEKLIFKHYFVETTRRRPVGKN
ncbi:hypothetical protein AAVH_17168 [Aphelenchoides avenae]|nr:hypothetical protein AAVH_17168 [Aphelenchus avenae]